MSNVYYQHKVFTHRGTVMTLSGLCKALAKGERVDILALHPSGIIAPAKVRSVEPAKTKDMWRVTAGVGRAVNADLPTELLTTEGWRTVDSIIPKETSLRVGPSGKYSMDGVHFALSGVLRHRDYPEETVDVVVGAVVEDIQKSVYVWNGDNYAMTVSMVEVDNFLITSGIIIKSNGDS